MDRRVAERLLIESQHSLGIPAKRTAYIACEVLPIGIKAGLGVASKEEFFKAIDVYRQIFNLDRSQAADEIRSVTSMLKQLEEQVKNGDEQNAKIQEELKKSKMKGATIGEIMKAKGIDLQQVVRK